MSLRDAISRGIPPAPEPVPPQPHWMHPKYVRAFWEKVDLHGPLYLGTPCWLWKGGCTKNFGYFRGEPATRVAWRFYHPVPDGLLYHRCGTPRCVNPAHLHTHDKKPLQPTQVPHAPA